MAKMNEDVFNSILDDIFNGLSLRAASADKDVDPRLFYNYMNDDKKRVQQYACACEARAELKVSDIHEIADVEEDVQRARLKIDVIKWEASKLKPKKYGDTTKHEHSGADGGPIQMIVNTKFK